MTNEACVSVWRLEDINTGLGIYQELADQVNIPGKRTAQHPGPAEDGPVLQHAWKTLGDRRYDFKFGFADLMQAARWFDKCSYLVRLETVGAVLSRYEVPADAVVFGEKQVIFEAVQAVCRESLKPSITLKPYIKQVRAFRTEQRRGKRVRLPLYPETRCPASHATP